VQTATRGEDGCPVRWQARAPDDAMTGTGVLREQASSFRMRANDSQIYRRGQLSATAGLLRAFTEDVFSVRSASVQNHAPRLLFC